MISMCKLIDGHLDCPVDTILNVPKNIVEPHAFD